MLKTDEHVTQAHVELIGAQITRLHAFSIRVDGEHTPTEAHEPLNQHHSMFSVESWLANQFHPVGDTVIPALGKFAPDLASCESASFFKYFLFLQFNFINSNASMRFTSGSAS